MVLKQIVLLTTLCITHAFQDSSIVYWNGGQYYLGKTKSTWQEAKQFCRAFWGYENGDLVTINDVEEDNFLYKIIKDNGSKNTYIGSSDLKEEGKWIWNNNCSVNYTNWALGEPDNYINEDCAHILGQSGKWNDISCIAKFWFICERERKDIQCGEPVFYWNGSEYYLGKNSSSWKDAAQFCYRFWGPGNGNLVSINDAYENSFVYELVKNNGIQNTYIGGNDIAEEGKWIWNDNCSFTYTNWNFSQPDNYLKQDCAHILKDSGKWDDVDCHTKLWFICERRNQSMNCGETIFNWNGGQYYLGKSNLTWQEAKEFCTGFWGEGNGDLVTIDDVYENEYIFGILSNNGYANTYISGNDINQEGRWLWSNDCPFKYRNWDCEQPDNYNKEDCAYMVGDMGVWNDIDCETKLYFMCERKISETNCGEIKLKVHNWNHGQYYFGNILKTWQSANKFCKRFWGHGNGNLVTVDDHEENNFLYKIIKRYGDENTYIGGKYFKENENWIWNDNCPFNYTNWNDHKDKYFDQEKCVHIMKGSGKWNKKSCGKKMWYICERKRNDIHCGKPVINWKFGQYFHGKFSITWKEAKYFCRGFWGEGNGDLVVINDSKENDFLLRIINRSGKQNTYIGASTVRKESKWIWNDKCPLKYTNWSDGQPEDYEEKKCAYLTGNYGTWNNIACDANLWFICERKSKINNC